MGTSVMTLYMRLKLFFIFQRRFLVFAQVVLTTTWLAQLLDIFACIESGVHPDAFVVRVQVSCTRHTGCLVGCICLELLPDAKSIPFLNRHFIVD